MNIFCALVLGRRDALRCWRQLHVDRFKDNLKIYNILNLWVRSITRMIWLIRHCSEGVVTLLGARTSLSTSWVSRSSSSFPFPLARHDNMLKKTGERGGSVVECRTPEREVGGSIPTAAVLCPWARHFTPRKYWLITQEAVAPSRHDWKIVDWDLKPQYKQTKLKKRVPFNVVLPLKKSGSEEEVTWP